MKFSICISLLLCAIFAQGFEFHSRPNALNIQPKNEALDKLREFIEGIAKAVQEAVNLILVKTENILVKIYRSVEDIVKEAENEFIGVLSIIIDDLEKRSKESDVAQKCFEASYVAFTALVKEATNDYNTCSSNAIEQSKIIFKDIETEIGAAQKNIGALKGLVDECLEASSNPVDVGRCVINKGTQIREIALGLIKNAENALTVGVTESNKIVHETKICVEAASQKAGQKLLTIVKDVNSCISNGKTY